MFFAASVDDPDTNREFATSVGADYPILSDPGKGVATAYGVLSERGLANRWTFYIGPDGTILHVDQEVNPSTAGEDIIARLEALGIGSP